MPRGNAGQSKVHYQGQDEDFVVLIDDPESMQKWKNDRSIPLAQVVSGFKIFITHKYVLPLDCKSTSCLTHPLLSSSGDFHVNYSLLLRATLQFVVFLIGITADTSVVQ